MWKANQPETMKNCSLRLLLHQAWLERKKNFDNEIDFSNCCPLLQRIAYLDEMPHQIMLAKEGGQEHSFLCTACCQNKSTAPQVIHDPASLKITGEKLRWGQCSGLIFLAGNSLTTENSDYLEVLDYLSSAHCRVSVVTSNPYWEDGLMLHRAGISHLTMIISAREYVNGTWNKSGEEKDILFARLKEIGKWEADLSLLLIIDGDLEQELDLIIRLADIKYSRLTVLYNSPSKGAVEAGSLEQCARLVAITRILNPETRLIFAGANTVQSRASLLEQYVLNAGVNEIAGPSPEAVSLAKDLGLKPQYTKRCCLVG